MDESFYSSLRFKNDSFQLDVELFLIMLLLKFGYEDRVVVKAVPKQKAMPRQPSAPPPQHGGASSSNSLSSIITQSAIELSQDPICVIGMLGIELIY